MLKQGWDFLWKRRVHLGLLLLAILLRLACVPTRSNDYIHYLNPWSNFIVEHGGWPALKHYFANYTPLYLYWLVIASKLTWLPRLLAIKLLPMAVDFLCAGLVYRIVKLKFPTGFRATAAFYALVFSPTIIANSSLWGQCDILYTTGLVACLYCLCIDRKHLAFLGLGIAFALKIQAIFLMLFLFTLLLRHYVKLWQFVYVPFTYVITMIPAWLSGASRGRYLFTYAMQIDDNKDLTREAPNLYQWFPNQNYSIVMPVGVLLTACLIVVISVAMARWKVTIEPNFLVSLYVTSTLVIPFFLPRMHDRYFFPADVGTLLFAAYYPKYTWVPIVMQLASGLAYLTYFNNDFRFLLKYCSIGVAIVIFFVIRHLQQQFPAPMMSSLGVNE
jgi:Gpi18-like mannosyltransferase